MSDLLAARSQMGMSLAFHIIFAVVGVALPLMMTIAEFLWHKTGDAAYLVLAKRWAKGTAILFAVGAVSGTVLSFELGLLWPKFMAFAGSVIGMPFSLEGFAFFTEAIFLGVYLYGWTRVSARAHLTAGVIVSISGLASAVFVTIANAWMNTPRGFELVNGQFTNIHPFAAMQNPAAFPECLHIVLAAYCASGFATAGIHSWLLIRSGRNRFHEAAIMIALTVGGTAAIVQMLSGDVLARMVATNQPTKLASLEGQFQTETGAPLRIGGLPDMDKRETRYAIEIPDGLSLLAFHNPHSTIRGLDDVPQKDWPNVPLVHISFQIMVGTGSILVLVALYGGWLLWRKPPLLNHRFFLKLLVLTGPLGFVALESGWMVTELGRQPWIIQGIMRTSAAVSPMPNLMIPFLIVSATYLLLSVIVIWLFVGHIIVSPTPEELNTGSLTGVHHAA
jgi:cytochrome bd ubiquinol oxidase subunit I